MLGVKATERIDEQVQSLLRAESREVADGKGIAGGSWLTIVAGEVDAEWKLMKAIERQGQLGRHVLGVVAAVRDKAIEVASAVSQSIDHSAAICVR